MTRNLALLGLLLIGCSAAHPLPDSLSSKIGQEVELRGQFGGPGKLADYIIVGQEQIYLFELPKTEGLKYGAVIAARGKLEHAPGAPGASCDSNDDCAEPGLPEHYFIRRAAIAIEP
jgi:hypothetical protein